MSTRQGLTAQEENKLKHFINQGKSWEDILKLHSEQDARQPLFDGVNMDAVKKTIFDPLVKRLEVAGKAGHKTIHELDSAEATAKRKAANEKK